MATLPGAPSDLPLEQLTLYQTSDPYLSSVFVFYGPVATANATVSSSRIQAHILTPAGFQSFSRITVSPAAPLYAAVNHLPREKQGDEVCRGLAVSMLKYFAELSDPAKECLQTMARAGKPDGKIPKMFDEMHAADLANRMIKVNQSSDIVNDIRGTFQERKVPWVDVDVVLPPGTIQPSQSPNPDDPEDQDGDMDDTTDVHYGKYTALLRSMGSPTFLPTSRLKRAPSQSTNVSKSKVFTRSQKESFRLKMCEFVDTEERYVNKLYTLVRNVAEEFRLKAQERRASSTSPNESDLATLFPPCLNEILDVNMGFLEVIRQVLEETEKDAIEDIGIDTELLSSMSQRTPSGQIENDAIGAVSFANALLEWFPRFSQPYADYMRTHTSFTQTLNSFMRDKHSSFSKRVQDTGEQLLRSLLMEPVQRLPRYSLLIDTMTGSLPLVHPAVRPFLKARDVIKDICSLDNPSSTNHDGSFRRLKERVDGWPSTILPTGRLITAVDFYELSPPYHLNAPTSDPSPGIMLIYKNCLVLLAKAVGSTTSARGLLAELDNAASTTSSTSRSLPSMDIRVVQVYDLHTVRCMQSTCGRALFLAPTSISSRPNQNTTVDLLALEPASMYEGRAGRVIEEIVKAKIEGRFSEKERENGKWSLRSPSGTAGNMGILACVFEEDQDASMGRAGCSKIRVVFDTSRVDCTKILQTSDLEMIVSVSASNEELYRVDIESVAGNASSDIVTADSFVAVLSKRLLNVLVPLHGPQNRTMTESIVHSNFEILSYLAGYVVAQLKAPRGFRPPSPSKLLSSLLGGGQSKENHTPSSKGPNSATLLGEFPKMPPPRANLSRANTMPSAFPGKEDKKDDPSSKISVVGTTSSKGQESPFSILEQTFAAYVLALQSRSGNIVGRSLRGRDGVDRSAVNELYNILLEDPGKIQAAAEVPVDILFVAFETFMENAWREHMGPVLDPPVLRVLQSQFDAMFPRDFDDNFRKFLAEMSPQNRRALASLVRLLAELLDASGNDGDRGALTAAFAEVLAVEGDPIQYISLLDRLVDDFDYLFEEFIPGGASVEGTLNCDQTKPILHNTGSVSSNASSFRRRFGFGLHRENSKLESESKVSSILRTLSKTKGPSDSEPNTPKGSLLRSKSIDVDTGLGYFLRPGSRDRPSASQEQLRRPDSSREETPSLSSIRGIPSANGVVKARYGVFRYVRYIFRPRSEAINSDVLESFPTRDYDPNQATSFTDKLRFGLYTEPLTCKGWLSCALDIPESPLRDRLQSEKRAQNAAQLGLKDELDLIGEELRALNITPQQANTAGQSSESLGDLYSTSAASAALLSRVQNLESKFEIVSGELGGRTSVIEKDLESSLVVSEKRAKKLDELYREASAENEALYDRFNTELNKIAQEVRSGNGEDALKTYLSSAMDEIGRLKKENFRLKREVGGLRAQQAAVALLKASE
ncbi:hypothetical protein FE257_007322 [Aspergillus nanangensis]|uniref:DH domain-containing protein n=1 Tax=Aspergillus nanangensis TaxID=2582783 RepID=A0AAD4GU84_ASPNN|nr:hypothetical protein FE257_007322 [Aspergillus nanangensis]